MRSNEERQWLADQLLAAVREKPGQTTGELVTAVYGPGAVYPAYSHVYQTLRSLDRRGLVEWVRWDPNIQRALWRPCDEPGWRDDLADIERLLAASEEGS